MLDNSNLDTNTFTLGGVVKYDPYRGTTSNGGKWVSFTLDHSKQLSNGASLHLNMVCKSFDDKIAKQLSELHTGDALVVNGSIENEKYQKKDGTTAYQNFIKIKMFRFLNKSNKDVAELDDVIDEDFTKRARNFNKQVEETPVEETKTDNDNIFNDDDLPF